MAANGRLWESQLARIMSETGRKAAKSLIVSTTGFRILQIVAERPRWVEHGRLIVACLPDFLLFRKRQRTSALKKNGFKTYI